MLSSTVGTGSGSASYQFGIEQAQAGINQNEALFDARPGVYGVTQD